MRWYVTSRTRKDIGFYGSLSASIVPVDENIVFEMSSEGIDKENAVLGEIIGEALYK